MPIAIAVNTDLIDKGENSPRGSHSRGFEPCDVTPQELAALINQGFAIAPQCRDGYRNSANFLRSGFLGLDIDSGWTINEALADPYVQAHAAVLYTTVNHQKNGNGDKFRLIFPLEVPITDPRAHVAVQKALLQKFPMADQCCKDAARIFYGSSNSNPIVLDGILSQADLEELVLLYPPEASKRDAAEHSQYKERQIPVSEARKMLALLPSQPGYEGWRNIVWSITDYYGEAGLELIHEWSPDDQNGTVIQNLHDSNNGSWTIGTVIRKAQERGYKLPDQYKLDFDWKKPGPIAMAELFPSEKGVYSNGEQLFEYKEGYYQYLDERQAKLRILELFEEKYPKFADNAAIENAFKYITKKCYIDSSLINPPGLNVNNGFVRILYDDCGNPVPELVPHSKDLRCNYKAPFNFDSEADCSVLDAALNSMLNPDDQTVLLRMLAATLDIDRVRRAHTRSIRALFLLGDGSNGKDTLRVWLSMLYGGHGVTSIGLQAFQDADNGRNFGLAPLEHSRLNHSSENATVALSKSNTLKAAITGDPITIERKHVQGYETMPKTVFLFNVNEIPAFDRNSQALASRFVLLQFPYTFCNHPDPAKSHERQSDPRLKDDAEYISQNILPALFNRLVLELGNVLQVGIDFSLSKQRLQAVLEDNSHFMQFVKDTGLEECSLTEGVYAGQAFETYEGWCVQAGYLTHLFTGKSYIDPSKSDKIVRAANRLKQELLKVFPNLKMVSDSRGTKYSVRFNPGKARLGALSGDGLSTRDDVVAS